MSAIDGVIFMSRKAKEFEDKETKKRPLICGRNIYIFYYRLQQHLQHLQQHLQQHLHHLQRQQQQGRHIIAPPLCLLVHTMQSRDKM